LAKIIVSSGKRKTAIARATLKRGSGLILINSVPVELIQPESVRFKILEPLMLIGGDRLSGVDVMVSVRGGGMMGQAEAARMAIARGLVKWFKSSNLEEIFVDYDRTMLSGDPRRTEPKKFGGPSARRKYQKSYR